MKSRFFISVIIYSWVYLSVAQQNSVVRIWKSNEEVADQLAADQLFDAALSMYLEEALSQNIFNEDGTVTNSILSLKIADTYFKLRKLDQAAIFYGYVVPFESDSLEQQYLLRYAESLLYIDQIEKARQWFNAYYLRSSDPLGKERFQGTMIYDELMASIKPTTIKNVVFNNEKSFITPVRVNGVLYFSGPQQKSKWWDNLYLQGDMEIYRLYKVDSAGMNNINVPNELFNVSNPVFIDENKVLITASTKRNPRLLLYEGIITDDLNWGNFEVSTLNDSVGSIHSFHFQSGGDTLYFSSNRLEGFGGYDLYYSVRSERGWSSPVNLGPFINTSAHEIHPFSGFGHFCFSSDGHPGLGGFDMFTYENDEVINMASPLNTSRDDLGVFFTDANHGYFYSNRMGGEGKDDIYSFTQLENPEVPFEMTLTRKVNDAMMTEASVHLQSLKGDHKLSFETDEEGVLKALLHTRTNYQLRIEKEGFITLIDTLQIVLEAVKKSYQLDELYEFQALVFSAENDAAINQPLIFIENLTTHKRSEIRGNATGFFKISQPSHSEVAILITKEGFSFHSDTLTFDQKEQAKTYTLKKVQPAGSLTLKDLLYELDQYKLQDDYVPVLDSIATSLKKFSNLRIIIESHTDARGDRDYNLQLSQKRAESVRDYLVSKGIAADRVGAVGKGESQLLNECLDGVRCTDDQHRINRRTEIKLYRSQ